MYCRNCGKEVSAEAIMCVACGVPPKSGKRFCQNCGAETSLNAEVCIKCGSRLATSTPTEGVKSKLAAGLLGILLGGLGIHRFYLGYIGIGAAMLILYLFGWFFTFFSIFTCGISSIIGIPLLVAVQIWGLIEGILILTGSINKDAKGRPLRE